MSKALYVEDKLPLKIPLQTHLSEQLNEQIALELHDNVSSKLALVRLLLFQNASKEPETIALLDDIITTVRNLSHGLPNQFDEHISLIEAIQDFTTPLHNHLKIKIRCTQYPILKLSKKVKLHLFRIFQEVMNNIIKHSYGSEVHITMRFSNRNVVLSILDNGIGFIQKTKPGLGLYNIKLRASKLNAKYKFIIHKKGTQFIIVTPIKYSL